MDSSAILRDHGVPLAPLPNASGTFSHPRTIFIVTSVAMAAIAGVAAFFCFKYGFLMLDFSASTLQVFGGRFLIYMGLAFGTVSTLNLAVGVGGGLLPGKLGQSYDVDTFRLHTAGSILAPILAIPLALCYGAK